MPDMTPQRWAYTTAYLRGIFGTEDQQLATLMPRAVAAGLPDIAVSSDVGRLLKLLTGLTRGRLALELGTLAGYSGIWIARGLAPGGRLITLEPEPLHADFAQREFAAANLADRVELRRAKALDALPALAAELGEGSLDLVFFDAIKREYPAYWSLVRPLLTVGGLLIADNILGAGDWWIDETPGTSPDRDAADRFTRAVACDPDFDSTGFPLREGVLVARRLR
ncbi:MAG TPA: O-methyltransferase [Phycisphaerales bacterium]|nr:O-methyltransferase [Phycisphaerales bacterium]